MESILDGDSLPTYKELARYVFYTATGEEFDDKAVNEKKRFIGESRNYQVFLFYEPNLERLKNLAFTLDMAKSLPPLKKEKRRLVFAPTKYLDQDHLDQFRIDFAQLPFEIYELTRYRRECRTDNGICDPIKPRDRYRHVHVRAKGRIVFFRIQLETLVGEKWMPVVRYDTAHGFVHRDLLDKRGYAMQDAAL